MHGREGIARKMVEPIPEAELIEGVRRGDPAAFEALVGRYLRRAHALALRLLGHPEDAEDLVQEVFMTVLEKIDTFEPGRPFGPWFFQILRNRGRSEEHTSELQSRGQLVCRLLLEKKKH